MPKRQRILLVDDDPILTVVVDTVLQKEGFQVLKAGDGRVAASLIASPVPAPDLVLCDMMMPGMDGLELLAVIRASPAWRKVPVIMLTGNGKADDIRNAVAGGADGYIVKPFDHTDLIARIKRFLA
jgi:CheY-like chemotaxis protein